MIRDFAGARGLEDLGLSLAFSAGDSAGFRARLAGASLPGVVVYRIAANAFRGERTPELIDREPSDAVHFVMAEAGDAVVVVQHRRRMLEPGAVAVLWNSRPYAVESGEASVLLCVTVPVAALLASSARLERAMSVGIAPTASAAALEAVAGSLTGAESESAGAEGYLVARALIELCRAVLATSTGAQERDDAASVRARALEYIDAHLADPTLDSASIARGIAISRRRLHRLFEGEPLSVAALIRLRRLERLDDGYATGGMTFAGAALAAGFGSVAAAYRAFRAHHGSAPSEYLEARRRDASR